jgi:hypothetical protein
VLIEAVAPQLTRSAGPAARSALKFLFRVGDELARSTARTREQVEDFVASTRAEYEAEQARNGTGEAPDDRMDGAPGAADTHASGREA